VVAKSKKQATKPSAATNATNITRIKASDSSDKTEAKKPAKATKVARKSSSIKKGFNILKPFKALGTYFKGAWFELKQVSWPNRQATWGMTSAVLLFTLFFIVLILLLDMLFKYVFQLILG
jgi:preprotein translocase subunit SecE